MYSTAYELCCHISIDGRLTIYGLSRGQQFLLSSSDATADVIGKLD